MIPPQRKGKDMVAKMHRIHLPKIGEGVIYIPGGVPYEADTIPLYDAGAYVRLGNKEFIYAIASGTLKTDRGAKNCLTQTVGFSALAVKIVKGDLTVSLTHDAVMDEDFLKGGEIVVFGPDNACFTRGIISHPSVTLAESYLLVVTMDSPAPKDFALTEHAECMANPYSAVKEANDEWAPVMGIPTVEATDGQGLWLQVSGPSWCSPVLGAGGPGGAIDLIDLVFNSDGSLAVRDATDPAKQLAGCIRAKGSGGPGAPFVSLQIAH